MLFVTKNRLRNVIWIFYYLAKMDLFEILAKVIESNIENAKIIRI